MFIHPTERKSALLCFTLVVAFVLFLALALVAATGAYAVPHYSQAYTKRIITETAHAAGYGPVQTAALLHLSFHESRWHNFSHSSGECHGAFQLSRGMAHGHPWWKPGWNTRRAIRYIRHRYGTPTRALAFWHRHKWY